MFAPTTNRLLAALSPHSLERLMGFCTPVILPLKSPLYATDNHPVHAFFMTSGMASIVTCMEDGVSAEVGVIGLEGVVGAYHLLGPSKFPTNCFMQLDGTALRLTMRDLRTAFRSSEDIRDRVLEFVQSSSLTLSQVAGCNRLHDAGERLARWLLMAQDRAQSDDMYFTQEFLAMMVGSRRTTVTMIAGALQRAGLIGYSRGRVKILDRVRLEAAACDCYQISKDLFTNLYSYPAQTSPHTSDDVAPEDRGNNRQAGQNSTLATNRSRCS